MVQEDQRVHTDCNNKSTAILHASLSLSLDRPPQSSVSASKRSLHWKSLSLHRNYATRSPTVIIIINGVPVWVKELPYIRRGQSHQLEWHFGISRCTHERGFTQVKLTPEQATTASAYTFQNKALICEVIQCDAKHLELTMYLFSC